MPGDCESSFQHFFDGWKITARRFLVIERSDDMRLPLTGNLAVAGECCQHAFVSHVLAPGLEFLRASAELLAEAGHGRTEAVRVCIRNTSPLERFPKNRANRPGIAPVRPSQAARLKLMRFTESDLGSEGEARWYCAGGEQRRFGGTVPDPQLLAPESVGRSVSAKERRYRGRADARARKVTIWS
jgi:hypothetical protein